MSDTKKTGYMPVNDENDGVAKAPPQWHIKLDSDPPFYTAVDLDMRTHLIVQADLASRQKMPDAYRPDRDIYAPPQMYGLRPMRILMIGWWAATTRGFLFELLRQHHEVTFAGQVQSDLTVNDKKIPTLPLGAMPIYNVRQAGPLGTQSIPTHRVKLTSLLNILGYDFDLILHCQNWIDVEHDERSPIPYYFYFTEGFTPRIPRCAHRVFVPNEPMARIAKATYHSPYKVSYLPHMLPHQFSNMPFVPDINKRPVLCSFAGKIHHFQDLYNKRRDLVLELASKLGDDLEGHWPRNPDEVGGKPREPERGKGWLNGWEYRALLLQSQFVFNVPTPLGINMRDLEAPAAGACLLTKKTPDHEKLGFRDRYNCFFYDTVDEAIEIIRSGYDPLVAYNGYLLVNANHTSYDRAQTVYEQYLADYMTGWDEELKDTNTKLNFIPPKFTAKVRHAGQ